MVKAHHTPTRSGFKNAQDMFANLFYAKKESIDPARNIKRLTALLGVERANDYLANFAKVSKKVLV